MLPVHMGVYSSVLHWMKILPFCTNLQGSSLSSARYFCALVLSSPSVYLKIPAKWLPSVTRAPGELVLGSSVTGGVGLEKGALHVASFIIPVEVGGLLAKISPHIGLNSITTIFSLYWFPAPFCPDQNWSCFYLPPEALCTFFVFLTSSLFLSASLQSDFVFYAVWSFFFDI